MPLYSACSGENALFLVVYLTDLKGKDRKRSLNMQCSFYFGYAQFTEDVHFIQKLSLCKME